MSNTWKFPTMVAVSLVIGILSAAFKAPLWAVLPFSFALGFFWDRIWNAARAALARARGEETP